MLKTLIVAFLKLCKDRLVIGSAAGCLEVHFSDVVDALVPTEARIPLPFVVDIPPNV